MLKVTEDQWVCFLPFMFVSSVSKKLRQSAVVINYSIRKISEKKNTEVASLTPVSDKIEYEVYAKKLAFMN